MIGGLKKLQKWNRNKWEREAAWEREVVVEVREARENGVRENEWVREGSEKRQKGVTDHTMEVVATAVVSILPLNHL